MVQRIIQESARKARVASSFLPLVGPLSDGQASVPLLGMTEPMLDDRLRGEAPQRFDIDDGETRKLTSIACKVYLRTQQAEDPDLASAKQMLGRAADLLARLEDAIVFRGQPGPDKRPTKDGSPDGDPVVTPEVYTVQGGGKYDGLLDAIIEPKHVKRDTDRRVNSESLVRKVVDAIQTVEAKGHYGPFACVLGSDLYLAANTPSPASLVLPSDRIIPFLDGGPLRRSSVMPPHQGVVVALAGAPIDLVVASDVHVTYLQLSLEPRYVLRVSQRFVLRIKQPFAVCPLKTDLAPNATQDEDNAPAKTKAKR
ncbi:MAG: encapsulin [Pseudonocardiaceae bacterium]